MIPVFQTVSDPNRGDCARAVIASLFDLEIEQVPNFRLFSDERWFSVYCGFIWGLGYEVMGTGYFPKFTPRAKHLTNCNVNGYVDATVPSLNFAGKVSHAVVMDLDGLVVHDPAPPGKKSYLGINVIETKALMNWMLIKPQEMEKDHD